MKRKQKTIRIPKNEVFDLLDDSSCKKIKDEGGKHDCTWRYYVFERSGKHYMIRLEFSYNDGLQIYGDSVEAKEVEPVEIVTIDYKPVYED